MKVRAKARIVEEGRVYTPGMIFSISAKRATELGDLVQILEKKNGKEKREISTAAANKAIENAQKTK